MDYSDYRDFCVERSHTDLDEISFRLLRASAGLIAEMREFLDESDPEKELEEAGDVLFWTVTLDYWLSVLEVPLQEDIKYTTEPLCTSAYILDCVEKYSRNRNIHKLLPVRAIVTMLLAQFDDKNSSSNWSFENLSTRNYDKLTSVKPRVSTTGV